MRGVDLEGLEGEIRFPPYREGAMTVNMKKRAVGVFAAAALASGGFLAVPALASSPHTSAQAFTCVHSVLYSGGYSLADGCSASNYKEKVNGTWRSAGWQPRGTKSRFWQCFSGWQQSSYDQRL